MIHQLRIKELLFNFFELFKKIFSYTFLGCSLIIAFSTKSFSIPIDDFDEALNSIDGYRGSNTQKFLEGLENIEKSIDSLNSEQINKLNYLKGYHQAILGEVENAIALYLLVLNRTDDIGLKYQVGFSTFNLYATSRDFNKALYYYNLSMSMYNKVDDHELKFTGLLAGMMLFNELGDYQQVLDIRDGLDYSNIPNSLVCKSDALFIRAKSNLGLINDDFDVFKHAISLCKNNSEPLYETFIRLDYVRTLINYGYYSLALDLLLKNIGSAKSTNYKLLIQEYYYLLAKSYWVNGDLVNTEAYLKLSIQNETGAEYSLPQTLTYQLLYQIEKQKQNYQQALFYAEKYAEADKAYLDDVQAKALAVQMAESDAIEQDRRIAKLHQQNRLLKLEQKVDLQEQENIRLIITVMLLIILLISVWAYRTKMVQRELKRISQFDELTNVFNRRQFTFLGERAVALAQRSGKPISVIMFDLDHFKSINDSYGHSMGDTVLKKAAAELSGFTRKSDIFGRLGGEEFAIVLPNCNAGEALEFAERCREKLNRISFKTTNDKCFQVTASFGVTDSSLSGFDLMEQLSHADHALYSAKGKDRNCVILYHQSQADLFSPPNLNLCSAKPSVA